MHRRRDISGAATRAAAALLCLGICACARHDGGPAAAADEFLSAVNRGDCAAAWSFYSSGTRENVRREVHRIRREAEAVTEPMTPETRYCKGSYGEYKRGSIRVTAQLDDRATVAVVFSEGSHLALIPFLSTPYREWTSELQLVREDGRWRIERPRVQVGRQGWDLVEVGDVDVAYSLRGDPNRRHVEASTVLQAPREALERILEDPQAWARLLPGIEQVEAEVGGDRRQQLRLRFMGWEQPVLVTAVPYGRPVRADIPWTTLQWSADGPRPAPVLYTGSWELRPRHAGGTRVSLGFVIEPGQMPPELAKLVIDAERVAAALVGLEREALRAGAAQ